MAITPITKKAGDSGVNLPLDNPAIVDALRRGNIQDVHKILADYGLTVEDFEQFAASQHSKYINNVVQPDPLYEGEAAIPPPSYEAFPDFDMSMSLGTFESQIADDIIIGAMEKKYGKVAAPAKGKGAAPGKGTAPGKGGQIDTGGMSSHADEAANFWSDVLEPKIIEAQMAQELQKKSDELEAELQKLLAMARSGQIDDPAILILALTRINVEKNGLIFSQLGRKIERYNTQSNKIIELLKNDPNFATNVMGAQQDLKTIGQSTQFLINDMNSVTQFINTALNFGKSSLDSFHSTKMEIIRKISVGS